MKKSVSRLLTKEVGATSDVVLCELVRRSSFFIVYRICPEYVAEESLPWRFLEPLQVFQIIYGFELWGEATVKCKKLVVDQTGDG